MTRPIALAALLPLFAAPTPALAVPGGTIDTLPVGTYVCSTLGDATGAALVHVPDADFSVLIPSSYQAGDRRGAYLRLGDKLTMTSGPFSGTRFAIDNNGFLQRLGRDGAPDGLSCSRGVPPEMQGKDCPDEPANPAS